MRRNDIGGNGASLPGAGVNGVDPLTFEMGSQSLGLPMPFSGKGDIGKAMAFFGVVRSRLTVSY
jgi:hypothetical protein